MQLYNVEALFEASIDYNGTNYIVIYGHHINGGFCAIPNHNISCEMASNTNDTYYNAEKLSHAGLNKDVAMHLAMQIKEISKFIFELED